MNSVKEMAYAKVNLYLDVASKREDGFHDIKTVMHTVSLFDEITVSVKPSSKLSFRLVIDNKDEAPSYLPTDDGNIAVKAARAFYEAYDATAEVLIRLEKKIPISSGLAGGSADAAAVLRALNRIYKRPFTEKRLAEIGAGVGSDVPFCIVGKTSSCEGRGEILRKLDSSLCYHFVIANSGEHVSTPVAYSMLDERFNDFKGIAELAEKKYANFLLKLEASNDFLTDCYNVFEKTIFEKCPKAAGIKQSLLLYGARMAMLSGSGASVFGIFDSEEQARAAAEKIRADGFFAEYAVSCDKL